MKTIREIVEGRDLPISIYIRAVDGIEEDFYKIIDVDGNFCTAEREGRLFDMQISLDTFARMTSPYEDELLKENSKENGYLNHYQTVLDIMSKRGEDNSKMNKNIASNKFTMNDIQCSIIVLEANLSKALDQMPIQNINTARDYLNDVYFHIGKIKGNI